MARSVRLRAKNFMRQAVTGCAGYVASNRRTARALFAMVAIDNYWMDNANEDAKFLAFCAGVKDICRAQILQDAWVLYETQLKAGGYFVEVGAFDSETHSNSFFLERHLNWSGVLVEPNPALVPGLRQARACAVDPRCVWNSTGDKVTLAVTEDRELSAVAADSSPDSHSKTRAETIVSEVAVETVTLNDLLTQHGAPRQPDFVSIDTEGNELRILQEFDFEAHRPLLLAVEHNNRRSEEDEIDSILERNGYTRRFPQFSGWDGWYRSL